MGVYFSSHLVGNDSFESSRVQAFHSLDEWRSHFDSLKNNQLHGVECGPCLFMEPVINGMAEKFTDVVFVRIDVDELTDVSREYGVQSMPTYLLLKQGKEVGKVVGAKKEELKKMIEQHRTPTNTT